MRVDEPGSPGGHVSLTVLSVAYPLAPVGADAVGGAEQVLGMLDRALVRAGQRSIVVACEGSRVAGELIETPLPPGPYGDEARRMVHARHRANIERALTRYPVDLVHMHGIDFDAYLPPGDVPALVTLHLPPAWYAPHVFNLSRRQTFLHCVSASQERACPPAANLLPYIENGVDVERLRTRTGKRGYVIALGRICPEKGFHLALDAAKRAGRPMLLAGEVYGYEAHRRYFSEEIVPRLDQSRRFIGRLTLERKRRLLGGARCLLVPCLAPETSSLVAMEALACGTPVVAFPAGALADIVADGLTGYLVQDEIEMASAIEAAGSIDRERCRRAACERFSAQRMIGEYFALYARLSSAACARAASLPPAATAGRA